jgi:hypothetical protein
MKGEHMSDTTTITRYVCTKCKAEDSDRSSHPPIVLNCWNCKAGRGVEIQEMISQRIGMYPVKQ